MSYWGYHMILDCAKCSPTKLQSYMNIYNFSKTLVKRIDMVPFGEPLIKHFGHGNKAGYTLVQLISTSNICAHFVEETNDMYLDVFSCKTFSPKTVESTVREFFETEHIHTQFLRRQAKTEVLA